MTRLHYLQMSDWRPVSGGRDTVLGTKSPQRRARTSNRGVSQAALLNALCHSRASLDRLTMLSTAIRSTPCIAACCLRRMQPRFARTCWGASAWLAGDDWRRRTAQRVGDVPARIL